MKRIALLLLCALASQANALEADKRFFSNYCIRCHGAEKQEGDVRLDTLTWEPDNADSLQLWHDVIDMLELGEMPPEQATQPKPQEIARLTADLKQRFAGLTSSAEVVLRRLNNRQYTNTVRDLMYVNAHQLEPAKTFPTDDKFEGYDNVADVQAMSDFLLSKALQAGSLILDDAAIPSDKPRVETYQMGDVTGKSKKERDVYFRPIRTIQFGDYVNLYANDESEPGDTRGQSVLSSIFGVPHTGTYEYIWEVESVGRGNHNEKMTRPVAFGSMVTARPSTQKYHPEDLHRLEIYLVKPNPNKNPGDTRGMIRELVESIDLEDNQRYTIKRSYHLRKTWKVQLAWGNGPVGGNARSYYQRIMGEEPPLPEDKDQRRHFERVELPKIIHQTIEKENLPRIKVYAASRKGPTYDVWPPKSHQQLYGKPVEEAIFDLAQRAFRRPVAKWEVQHFVDLAKNSEDGIHTAIQAMLCSPNFLYMVESSDGKLNQYEIANRLSYAFWNTMPDDELFELAKSGKLHDEKVLKEQALRLLNDPRSEEFVHSFLWGWLRLQSTIEMAPDSEKFFDYKRYRINEAMVKETKLFFRDVLDNNRPLSTFIDADFTYVNADLARRYGLQQKIDTTAKFQKVSLPKDSLRRGLFGQTSVLTASANGVDTSPVVRGVWILENLLGIHPPPPPDDVDIPEIDIRGEHTLKELYAKHRQIESCHSCHAKIDPLGFALENFNAAGVWRDVYKNGSEVDATGNMPDGTPFDGVSGLKANILKDMTSFNRNFVNELLTYTAGRKMQPSDRTIIDQITGKIQAEELGLRDVLLEVVTSDVFLSK